MASAIIVVVIFVLLALAILFICHERRLAGRPRRQLCQLPQQMRRSGKEAEEIALASLCEGGGPAGPEGENLAAIRNISDNGKVLSPTASRAEPPRREGQER